MKGILLAGGRGSRLYPLTAIVSKQLQPIYNKPMIYYSLTSLLLAGVRDILLITAPEDVQLYRQLLADGSQWGIRLTYATQDQPRGIADALLIGAEHAGESHVMLMLGDNLIYGRFDFLRAAIAATGNDATIFAYHVADPRAYGVVELDRANKPVSLEEKPAQPRSSWAVPGMYIYPPDAAQEAAKVVPSPRGELEITDLNRRYLALGRLRVCSMGRGIAWLDTGTPETLLDASNFVHTLESRQGLMIGSPEEASYRMGYLSREGLGAAITRLPNSAYRGYLERVVSEP